MRNQNMLLAVLHETLSCKSFWENQHSSECFACGSRTAPGSAAGPSDAPQTVSPPADQNARINIQEEFGPIWASTTTSLPLPHMGKREPYLVLALAKKPQLIVPSALLCFQLQDFILKGLFSGNSLVFYPVDLNKRKTNWENPSTFCLKQLRMCVSINNSRSISINKKRTVVVAGWCGTLVDLSLDKACVSH